MAAVLVLAAVTLTGCSQNAGPFMALLTNTGTSDDGADLAVEQETAADVFSRSGIYDSEDAAVVVKKDLEAGTVQFQNIATSRRYTLTYDGTTTVYDKNDQALSMEQLKEGSVVTVRFYKPRKALAYVKENPTASATVTCAATAWICERVRSRSGTSSTTSAATSLSCRTAGRRI